LPVAPTALRIASLLCHAAKRQAETKRAALAGARSKISKLHIQLPLYIAFSVPQSTLRRKVLKTKQMKFFTSGCETFHKRDRVKITRKPPKGYVKTTIPRPFLHVNNR